MYQGSLEVDKIDTTAFIVDLESIVSGSSDIMMLNELADYYGEFKTVMLQLRKISLPLDLV